MGVLEFVCWLHDQRGGLLFRITLTFDVKTMFNGWYSADSTYGSLVTLRLPLKIQGDVHGLVAVTLRNAIGVSVPVTFQLP